MKLLTCILSAFCVFFVSQVRAQNVIHEVSILGIAPHYIINDNAPLRAEPSTKGGLVKTLPLGTKCYLLEMRPDTVIVNGVQSGWYKAKTDDGYTGWIWGGNIAQYVFGSNTDVNVKFLMGYGEPKQRKDVTEYAFTVPVIQIKAIKNGKLIDKLEVEMWGYYFDAAITGNMGLNNVKDVLTLHQPCIGGCGCSTGDNYIFWDGKGLHFVTYVGGTADADYSEWASLVFPSNGAGESGFLVRYEDVVVGSRDVDNYPNSLSIIKRQLTKTYYRWNGQQLVQVKEKPTIKKVYYTYFSDVQHESLEKPELWEDREDEEE